MQYTIQIHEMAAAWTVVGGIFFAIGEFKKEGRWGFQAIAIFIWLMTSGAWH